MSLQVAWQWAAGSGSPSHGPGPAFRRYGLKSQTLSATPGSAPGQPQVPTVCLWSLMLFDVLAVLSVISVPRVCLELTPRTTRTKQALSHGHRSSFIVHRPFVRPSVRCSSAGRSRPVSSYLSSIRLASYAPYAPYGPGCLPTYQPHTRLPLISLISLLCNRLSTSTSTNTSVPAASPYQRSTGLS